ncbi:MAG: 16S rRNA (cytosine(1402)-N(4))-methyltransferase RsmH [Clostridiales bacterium]|jgi:16S rRNA (cytosine1402-N4)-methyltransferase|nr:16S rRNA (cytosine(1402)-N(4))-methyltransferase RsmH [Clostridiales bacterium]
MEFNHVSVMLKECVDGLNIKSDGIYLDGTLGGGGHSLEIVKRLKSGKLIAVDRDEEALNAAKKRLKEYLSKINFAHDDFKNGVALLDRLGIEKLDGILLDLGVSSYQIDNEERGFSYRFDSALDMRMDRTQKLTAFDVVNGYSESDLVKIFFNYGEERFSKRIAQNIKKAAKEHAIKTTGELAELIKSGIPAKYRYADGNPCKRVFQSIRIEVNSELKGLYEGVINLSEKLRPGGRFAIISFHSLEDRIIKQAFKYLESSCICDKDMPICTCGKERQAVILTKKPLTATEEELKNNPRAESAKLRVMEKI